MEKNKEISKNEFELKKELNHNIETEIDFLANLLIDIYLKNKNA